MPKLGVDPKIEVVCFVPGCGWQGYRTRRNLKRACPKCQGASVIEKIHTVGAKHGNA
jgi:hypothetical protein